MNQSMDLKKIYLKDYTKETLIETICKTYADEKSSVLRRADLVLEGHYLFQNEWDMERSQESVYMPLDKVDWLYIPKLDMEWPYMFHRHTFLMDLLIATLYTDDMKYVDYLQKFMLSFITENPYSEKSAPFAYRTIDVAIRQVNWIRMIEIMEILEIELDESIYQTMAFNNQYLIERKKVNRTQSNWMAIESSAVLVYIQRVQDDEGFEFALSLYSLCMENQILSDGLQWEQSFMYHHEVLITALHVVQALGDRMPQEALEKARSMAYASRKIMRTDYTQSNFGDSDYEDLRSILLASEKILAVDLLHTQVPSTLFDFLYSGKTHASYGNYKSEALEHIYLEEAGIALVKNHQLNHTFMFANGPLGGGHGHDDFGHIDWMLQGKNFLVDSGRYTYHELNGSRSAFKTPMAHNVIVVDDCSYNEHLDSWSSSKVASGMGEKVLFKNEVSLFEGGHFGYSDEDSLTYVHRRALLIHCDTLLIIDTLRSDRVRKLSSNFIFGKGDLIQKDKKLIYKDDDLEMHIHPLTDVSAVEVDKTKVSPQYNLLEETNRLRISKETRNGRVMTLIAPQSVEAIEFVTVFDDNDHQYEADTVECLKFKKDKKTCYVLVQHKEPNDSRRAYCVDGNLVYGRTIYFEVVEDELIFKKVLY